MFGRRKSWLLATCTAGAVVVALPALAAGALTVGQTFTPTTGTSCVGGPDWEVMQTGRADSTSYRTTSAGVLTSWSFMSGADNTTLTMRVFRPAAVAGSYTVVADAGPLQTLPASSGLHTFPTRIPVHSGDIIGIHSTVGTCATGTSDAADTFAFRFGTITPVGATAAYTTSSGFIWDIAASLEPDADGDGFGDATQDACPQAATTQSACPAPDTIVTKKPAKRGFKRHVKIKFTSTVAGSTFSCSRDGNAYKSCTSPYQKRFGLGKHTLLIRGLSPVGIPEGEPAKVKFKILPQDA